MAVQVIKAKRQGTKQTLQAADRLRVAAYCRVSTDSEEQESSYEAQCRHYADYIGGNPGWILAGIYADEGISGTSTRKRDQFNRMIRDCEQGMIDMIITKSISRWARNTIDSLKSIRRLKDLGIPVIFEKENVNTMGAGGEVMITILSSIAQQESDSISKNVRMGIQYQFQQGKGRVNTSRLLGFTRGEDGKGLAIIPKEAKLVRRIYREYLEGCSPSLIASRLTSERICAPGGKEIWYPSTIVSILENEKYAGHMLMQKYYTVDFLTHKIAKNTGQLPRYFVEDAHEPIVPRDVYAQVQGEMLRRRALKYEPARLRFGSSDALMGRLVCGHCGRTLKRYTGPDASRIDWRCRQRAYQKKSPDKEMAGECPCRIVPETDAKRAILTAMNRLPQVRDDLIRMLGAVREGEIRLLDAALEAAQEDLDREELLLQRAEAENQEMRIRLLLELIDAMRAPGARGDSADDGPCYDYEDFFQRTRYAPDAKIIDRNGKITTFSDAMVIRYLEDVTILDDGYDVKFKCGLTVRVE